MLKVEIKQEALLAYLRDNNEYEFESWQLAEVMEMTRSMTNTYLRSLEDSGVVIRRKESYQVYWCVAEVELKPRHILTTLWFKGCFDDAVPIE